MADYVVPKFSRDQLLQGFQKANPTININQQIPPQQLYAALNQMSLRSSNVPYDEQTFDELVERVNTNQGILTAANYIDTHILAADILAFRNVQLNANQYSFGEFIQNLQNRINELRAQPQTHNGQNNEGIFIFFKHFLIKEQINSNNVKIRILNETMGIDQTMPFINQGGYQSIQLQNEKAALDGLDQVFSIEIFDDATNVTYGFVALNMFQLNISSPRRISLALTNDSLPTPYNLEIDGYVSIDNLQYALQDLETLKQNYSIFNEDLIGVNEQIIGLNSPFIGFNAAAPSANHSRNQSYQAVNNQMYLSPEVQGQQQNYPSNQGAQVYASPNAAVVKGIQPNQDEEDCDLSTQTLVSYIHYFLLGYVFVAIFLCLKRQMLLDVSIGISLLSILLKFNLQTYPLGQLLGKIFTGLFVFSAVLDLAWLIVFFPSWNRDISSEDQGAQSVIRILTLGISLLFMVYKIIMIIAIIYLNTAISTKGYEIQRTVVSFFDGIGLSTSLAKSNSQQQQFIGQQQSQPINYAQNAY